MILSFDYDRTYFPAFPVVEMSVVATASGGQKQAVVGLIDSGSDATQIPQQILLAIGAREIDRRWVRDLYGIRHPAPIYGVQIEIGDLLLPGIEVIGRPGIDEIIVGRDVLNQLIVTLNGLAHVAEVRD
jgi:predicted aspartyl protease